MKRINNEEEFEAVQSKIYQIIDKLNPTKEEEDELNALGDMLLEYEKENPPFITVEHDLGVVQDKIAKLQELDTLTPEQEENSCKAFVRLKEENLKEFKQMLLDYQKSKTISSISKEK